MRRVIVYCEGPTEETFVKRILAPFFYSYEVYLTASSCNGVSKYSIIRRDLSVLCKSDQNAIVTTMLDYYALPADTPGMKQKGDGDLYYKIHRIEAEISADVGADNLIPNLMVHEFEALLFSKLECFSYCGLKERAIKQLVEIRNKAESPEHINNHPETAPSKRILSIYPSYVKPLDGYNIAKDIGIDLMRRECRHFNEWIEKLIQLGSRTISII